MRAHNYEKSPAAPRSLVARSLRPSAGYAARNSPAPVGVGDSYGFTPAAFYDFDANRAAVLQSCAGKISGTVVQIHEEHRWFRVEAEVNGARIRECFKF